MSDSTLAPAPLEAVIPVFWQHGLQQAPDAALAAALGLSPAELAARYGDRAALVHQTTLADLARQKRHHDELYARFPTAVERLYSLIQYGIENLQQMPASYYAELQAFPQAWDAVMDHLATYSAPQLQQLLNDGIRQHLFRSDVNIQLVTKVILEQVNMLLNPGIFPPERYNMVEVFRSIFLYYIRGICTDEGARIAAEHFARL